MQSEGASDGLLKDQQTSSLVQDLFWWFQTGQSRNILRFHRFINLAIYSILNHMHVHLCTYVCARVAEFSSQTTCHICSTKWVWMQGSAQYGALVSSSECVSMYVCNCVYVAKMQACSQYGAKGLSQQPLPPSSWIVLNMPVLWLLSWFCSYIPLFSPQMKLAAYK